jgi:alkylation response protein AidB-like acyl-CoA dehydrogenase
MTDGCIEWVTEEQAEFHRSVVRFALALPQEDVARRDRAAEFWREGWDRCAAVGLPGLPVPECYGGAGADVVATMLALEALGYGCHDGGLVFSLNAHLWSSVVPLWLHGTDEQRDRWLPGLCKGDLIGSHAITEPEAGSDAFALRTRAVPSNGGFVLNGRKMFITNAPVADLMVIFARTKDALGPFGISAFVVERDTPGFCVEHPIDKMGLRTSPMSEVVLEDCHVPREAVLGGMDRGANVFDTAMRWERACIMASQVGVMRRTMESCARYARQRRQFGQAIGKFQAVADKIVNMKIALDASRLLVLRTGWLMDHGHDALAEAAIAKAFVAEASVRTQLDAIQIHGGYGYATDTGIERQLRDAVGGTIYSGTSEIQRLIIARSLSL